MKDITAIILAAGLGTRMKSDIPKVLHEILGKPIICHIIDSLKEAGIGDIITVTGHGSELLKKVVGGTKIVRQPKLLGSGDAVTAAKKLLKNYSGDILVICGDTPLIQPQTIRDIIAHHKSSGASLTLLTAKLKDPTGYGRILRQDNEKILKIIEEEKASLYEEVINEVNVGTYCFKSADLFKALLNVKTDNKKKEYFITDTVEILNKNSRLVESVLMKDESEMIGVNTRSDLAEATRIMKDKMLKKIMSEGVTIEDPSSTTIYPGTNIGRDTVIKPNTVIESDCEIGSSCVIGPFARIRTNVFIDDKAEVGNFVELVRTRIGSNTKVKHHTYLGDAIVGKGVNIGAGTITANYDGKNKNKTVIEDGAFIGVGAILIAPVKIGKGALVGAGCVVPKNHNVPKGATVVGIPARVLKRK